jgi:hypothetical protein
MRPIISGIADFQRLRAMGVPYADKTGLLYNLAMEEGTYFLSRPRRFGKTLLVSTLECILRGRRELFKGLWIDGSDYDWTPRPVIKLSMEAVKAPSVDSLNTKLAGVLKTIFRKENLSIESDDPPMMLLRLAAALHDKHGHPAALLIDEYDAPVTRHFTEPALAEKTLKSLAEFYGILKSSSRDIGLTLLTGVAKFDHESISASTNHLVDFTFDKDWASTCGFTSAEFDDLFQEHLETGLDEFISTGQLPKGATTADLREAIFGRYGGYSWDGRTRLLNPYSVLKCLKKRRLQNYWRRSPDHAFLVKLVKSRRGKSDLERREYVIDHYRNMLTLDDLKPIPLMFQTGCLTIKRSEFHGGRIYHLGFPNLEVAAAMAPQLLLGGGRIARPVEAVQHARAIRQSIVSRDAEGFRKAWASFLGHLSHRPQSPGEGFLHGALRLALIFSGQELAPSLQSNLAFTSEDLEEEGLSDIHFRAPETGDDYVIELKNLEVEVKSERETVFPPPEEVESRTAEALRQAMDWVERSLRARRFQRGDGKIWKVAIVFRTGGGAALAFEEASNWRLVESGDGGYKVEAAGPDQGAGS